MTDSSPNLPSKRTPAARGRLACLGVAAVLVGALLASGCNHGDAQAENKVKPPVVFVTQPITMDVIDSQEFTGRLDSIPTVNLVALVTGKLKKAPFKEGDMVQKGDLLFLIDPDPYQADYNLAKANLENAKANLELQKKNEVRARQLYGQNSISKEEYDTVIAAHAQAVAQVGSAQASLKRAELFLGYTEVRAPFTGRISRRNMDAENMVIANQTVLTTLVAQDPIYAYFDVDERTFLDLQNSADKAQSSWFSGMRAGTTEPTEPEIKPAAGSKDGKTTPNAATQNGQPPASKLVVPVLLRLSNEDHFSRRGTVDFIDNRVDGGTGTIRLRAAFKNANGALTAGLFGRVLLPTGRPYKSLLIPDEAIQSDQGRQYVLVVGSDNKVERRDITPGQALGQWRVVKTDEKAAKEKNLALTDRVIITGMQRVRPGVEAEVRKAPKPPEQPKETVLHQLYPPAAGGAEAPKGAAAE